MRPRSFVLMILFTFVILDSVCAIGIGPSEVKLQYVAGEEHRLAFWAINNADTPGFFEVYIEGELVDYVTPEKTQLTLKPQEYKEFFVRLKMPEYLEPGPHGVQVGVMERGNPKFGAISAKAGVKSNIAVDVPYPGKYLKAKVSADTVNLGETVNFKIDVTNLGKEPIAKVGSVVGIFENYQKIGFVDSSTVSLKPQEAKSLIANWLPIKGGEFIAVADVFYDGLSTKAETKFRVGELSVDIIDVAYDEILVGTIGRISVKMQSKWNSKIDNLFTELFIYKDGEFVTRINSNLFSLQPWGDYTDVIYWDTKGLQVGVYDGKIVLHYGGKTTEQNFKIGLSGQKKFGNTIYVAIIILLLTMIALSIVYSKQQKKK